MARTTKRAEPLSAERITMQLGRRWIQEVEEEEEGERRARGSHTPRITEPRTLQHPDPQHLLGPAWAHMLHFCMYRAVQYVPTVCTVLHLPLSELGPVGCFQ